MSVTGEKVDGPQIAADILARMEPGVRGRLLLKMAQKSPEITNVVARKLEFPNPLSSLPPIELEQGLQRVSETDIAFALQGQSELTKIHIFQHLSPHRQQLVLEKLDSLPILTSEATQLAQQKIVTVSRGKIVAVG